MLQDEQSGPRAKLTTGTGSPHSRLACLQGAGKCDVPAPRINVRPWASGWGFLWKASCGRARTVGAARIQEVKTLEVGELGSLYVEGRRG
eukprot:9313862-Pyramimonas_sp.AAC.1